VDELLAIGEFSARSGLSAKVLRSYVAAGLLVPAAVDPWTGYRYYAPGQLPEAALILLLRRAGVPLSEIAAFLRNPDPGQLPRWERALDQEVASRRRPLAGPDPVRPRTSASRCGSRSRRFWRSRTRPHGWP
jgi:PPM family protein phosphatase